METGYSLLLREYVQSRQVDYGDCADFQITCPACHEAIFKAGKLGHDRQYFSHFAASKSDVRECEFRVAALTHSEIERANIIGRGQTLEKFFATFRDPLLHWLFDGPKPAWLYQGDAESLKKEINWNIARPNFIRYAHYLRSVAISMHKAQASDNEQVWSIATEEIKPHRSKFWIQRQKAFAEDFWQHLQSPNASPAWNFMCAVALYLTGGILLPEIMGVSNKKLARKFAELEQTSLDYGDDSIHALALLSSSTLVQIHVLLLMVPYTMFLGGRIDTKNREILLKIRENQRPKD